LCLSAIPNTFDALRVVAVIVILVYHGNGTRTVNDRHARGATVIDELIVLPRPSYHHGRQLLPNGSTVDKVVGTIGGMEDTSLPNLMP
jgi:hypothetical protein